MKKKIYVILSTLFAILTLASCATKSESSALPSTPKASLTANTTSGESDSEDSAPVFTKQQIIEDFNSIIDVMEKNYPNFISAREMYGSDKDEIIERYKIKLDNLPDEIELKEAMKLVLDYFNEYGMTAHLIPFNYEYYNMFHETAKSIIGSDGYDTKAKEEWSETYNLLESETVKNTYQYLKNHDLTPEDLELVPRKRLGMDQAEIPFAIENPEVINENLSYKIIDSNTVYLSISSFEEILIDNDHKELLSFYKKFEEYKNLIIDITENGGGSDLYWMQNIVAPNISVPLTVTRYSLAKSTGIYDSLASNSEHNRTSENYKHIATLPEMTDEVLDELDLAFSGEMTVEPMGSGKMFNGNIYVLTGKNVYSASEGFSAFCKDTGFAILVGSDTGGDGNGPLAIKQFACPNTGLVYQFSTHYVLNSDGSSNTVTGTKPNHYVQEGESALDACLRVIE